MVQAPGARFPNGGGQPNGSVIARIFSSMGLSRLGRWQGLPIALFVLAVFIGLRWVDPADIRWLRLRQFDTLQTISPREFKFAPVLIVDIDEDSLTEFGQWPWPRYRLRALVENLAGAEPLAIGLDFIFSEPDRLSPENIAATMPDLSRQIRQDLAGLPSYDNQFGAAIAEAPVVVGTVGMDVLTPGQSGGKTPRSAYLVRGKNPSVSLPSYQDFLRNVPAITAGAKGEGLLNSTSDIDGIVRQVPLLGAVGDKLFPSFSLELLRVAFGEKLFAVHGDDGGVRGVSIADFFYPTGPDGRIWLHYTRHQPQRYVSAKDVLSGTVPSAAIKNRIILIGTSSAGLLDLRTTPIEKHMAGVEIHAQVLEMMAAGHALTRPRFALEVEIALLVVGAIVIIVLIPMFRPVWSPLPFLAVLISFAAVAWIAYARYRWLIDVSHAAIGNVALFAVMSASTWAAADSRRRQLGYELALERAAAARVQGELEAARQIQMGMLPQDFPAFPGRKDFDLHAFIEPAQSIGGDFYDFALLDHDHLFFMIGDVSGKGVPASLFMALSMALYKSGTLRRRRDIARIMSEVNNEICRENPKMLFVTVLAGILDLTSGELEWCNAGHEAPYFACAGQPPTAIKVDGGPPLGIVEDFVYQSSSATLHYGDVIVSLSDGVSEAMNQAGEMYNNRRLESVLAALRQRESAEGLVENIKSSVLEFADGAEPSDDITILVVKFAGQGDSAG
jgi:serine phosphatase RsbU (regulator of sigma subunit)